MFDKIRFTVIEDHLKLLRRACVYWEDGEFGAPAIDCKRPYGNSSVELDIAEILGWPISDNEGLTKQQYADAATIHRETEKVLQIALTTGTFETGTYEAEEYRWNWKKVS